MSDRDKIAEIIRGARINASPLAQLGYPEADALIERGMILPPCMVGDVVYVLRNGLVLETEILKVRYEKEAENYGNFIRERVYAVICNVLEEFNFSDFGKTVFLTHEEAEKKLEKCKENEE